MPNVAPEGARLGTMLGLPMTRDGQLIGVLALARREVESFSAKQIELATVFADQAAIAIENVRLINEIREKGWQLERALQHKSQFLATMSHELRTPMNGVLGMIDVLEAEGPGKDQTHTLNMMRESAQVLLRNINDLLDYSRIEAGALRLEELPFVLKDLIDGAIEVFKPQATRKGLSLVGIVASSPADAFIGDPTRVRQIIFNLLSNALKFTDRGGVMLRASAEPIDGNMARVVLAVTDTGIGISSEQQARLFKPFSQVDSSITRRFGGSGLGLSIVKQLSELMQGDVTVSSLPGSGATFIVTLKLRPTVVEQPALPAPRPAATAASAPAPGHRKALVVDDNPINCEVMLRQLKVLGMPADSAADGFAGFSSWRGGGYDIVFADVHMPVMDGFTMTSEIRGIENAEGRTRTPIVAVTADAMAGEEERCKAAGMDDYLAKPVGRPARRHEALAAGQDREGAAARAGGGKVRRGGPGHAGDRSERARSLGRERRRCAAQHPAAVQRDGLGLLARHRAGDGLRRPGDPAVRRPPAAQRRAGGRRAVAQQHRRSARERRPDRRSRGLRGPVRPSRRRDGPRTRPNRSLMPVAP